MGGTQGEWASQRGMGGTQGVWARRQMSGRNKGNVDRAKGEWVRTQDEIPNCIVGRRSWANTYSHFLDWPESAYAKEIPICD